VTDTIPSPAATVIVPTHNRRALLLDVLDALARQTAPPERFEVVVVADGCVDGTEEALAGLRLPFVLRVLQQPGVGPAGARNAGAQDARGQVLIFLDDDIEPSRSFVEAHLAFHADRGREDRPGLACGPYPPAPEVSSSLFRQSVRHWWLRHFDGVARPGHRVTYRDVLSGNLSLPRALWDHLGGFDAALRAHEDYAFGLRAIAAGVPVRFVPAASGVHREQETMTVSGSLRRAFEEGRADVHLAEAHPEARAGLRLVEQYHVRRSRWLARVVLATGKLGDGVAKRGLRLLPPLERAGLRSAYRAWLRVLNAYWYFRGVADRLGSEAAWRALARATASGPVPAGLRLDLRSGLVEAEAALDRAPAAQVDLLYGGDVLGVLPAQPGAEPWAGRHLRRAIADHVAFPYLRALARDGLIATGGVEADRRVLDGLAHAVRFAGRHPGEVMWDEETRQWDRALAPPGADRDGRDPS
jgi:GT2 family glycosyltransferase